MTAASANAENIEFRNYQLGMSIDKLIETMKQAGDWTAKNCSVGHSFCHLTATIKISRSRFIL